MSVVASVLSGLLIVSGLVAMVDSLWRNLVDSPTSWPWYKALFHPNYWIEPYGRRYACGVVVVLIGVVIGFAA